MGNLVLNSDDLLWGVVTTRGTRKAAEVQVVSCISISLVVLGMITL